MLVECPRCHFKQPQDQYCASCGVDMLAYKRKEDPLLTKIVQSGLFQFLMVVLLGLGVTYFVVRTDQPQQWIQRINRFASVSPNSQQAKTEAGIAQDSAEFEAPPPEANTWTSRSTSSTESSAAMSANSAVSSGATASSLTTANTHQTQLVSGTVKLFIRMVEIDHDYIDNLTTETNGRTTPINGNIKTFRSYPNVAIDSSNFKVLKTDVLEFNKDKKSLSLIAGHVSRGFRLTFQVMDEMNGETFRFLNATLTKAHPNDNQQLPIELFLNTNEKFIISGSDLMSYFELENDLTNVAPFTVFKSADYRNQKTTFAIIIELQ